MGRPAIVYTEEELNRPTKAIWIISDTTTHNFARESFFNDIKQLLKNDNRKKVIIISDNQIDDVKDVHHLAVSAFSLGTIRRLDFRDDPEEKAVKSACGRLKNGILIVTKKLSDKSLSYIYDSRKQGNDVVFFKNTLLPNTWEHENVLKSGNNVKFIIYARPSFELTDENVKSIGLMYGEKSISLICAQHYVTYKYASSIADFNKDNIEMELIREIEKPEFKNKIFESFVFDYETGSIYNYNLQDEAKFDESINLIFPKESNFQLELFKKDYLIIPQLVMKDMAEEKEA